MKGLKHFILLPTTILWQVFAVGQITPRPSATLDSNKILIGEQITLKLQLACNAQDTVTWPIILDTLSKNVEVISKTPIDTSYDEANLNVKYFTQFITLTSFDSGYYVVKPFTFKTSVDSFETEPILLQVNTVPTDTAKGIYDIKEPLSEKYSFVDWLKDHWKEITGILAIVALIIALIYYIRKQKNKPKTVVERPKPKIPPHIIALDKLDNLKEKKLWQSGKEKDFHSELSEIIREYIENRFHVTALEQTTSEIMTHLRYMDLEDENRTKLKKLLMLSDLVKFAKELPVASENEKSLQDAYDFVNTTVPRMSLNENDEEKAS